MPWLCRIGLHRTGQNFMPPWSIPRRTCRRCGHEINDW